MQKRDYRELAEVLEIIAQTTATAVWNAVHLAQTLRATPYPVQ